MNKSRGRFYANAGSPIKIVYSPYVNEDGSISLKESGKVNIQEEINSYRDSCDINVILSRVANGEVELLEKRKGTFANILNAPKSMAEALQLQIDSNNLFQSLPNDIKEKFDFDPNKFFAQAGTEEWYKICSPVLPYEMRSMNNTSPAPEKVEAADQTSE